MSDTGRLHRTMHRLGLYAGQLVFARDEAGFLWMAQRCRDCGAVSHKAPLLHIVKTGCNPGAPIEPEDAAFTLAPLGMNRSA